MEYNLHKNYIKPIFEDSQEALNIIREKVGGDFKRESRLSSFEGLTKGLDTLELREITENGDNIKAIFKYLIDKENIEFVDRYIKNQKSRTLAISSKLKKIKDIAEDDEFKKEVNIMMKVIERTFKLHNIIKPNLELVKSGQIYLGIQGEAPDEKIVTRAERIISNCEKTIAEKTKAIQKEGEEQLESALTIQNTEEAEEKVERVEKIFIDLGLEALLTKLDDIKNALSSKKEKEPKPKPEVNKEVKKEVVKKDTSTKKKILVARLLEAMKLSMLPELTGNEVKGQGGYYALYNTLKKKNTTFMEEVLTTKIFKPSQYTEKSSFYEKTRESAQESDQITYLNASKEWIKLYILSELDGQIESQRDLEKLLSEVQRIAEEKEREIRNYYTAKDFNLGQFQGLQIKPEIYLPLCLSRSRSEAECKINLPVSYKDRVKESPIKKYYLAISKIVGGLFSNIPDNSDTAFAQKAAERNKAIIQGISGIISGTLGLFSKQTSRDYETGIKNIKKRISDTFSDSKANEDMLGLPIVPMTEPGQLLQTPDSIPSSMDTFALLGPGKKEKSKKKKPMKAPISNNKVLGFDDFLKKSKNTK